MKLASFTALLVAAATASAHASPARKIHVVEGSWPTVAPRCYERIADVTFAYPREDGRVTTYLGSFPVALDPALEAVRRAGAHAHGTVRLERADGERAWHVVSFTPDR